MRTKIRSALLLVLFGSQADAQSGLTLSLGQLSFSGSYIKQVASVKNESGKLVRTIKVECGFFRQDQLIATGFAFIENVAPASSGFTDILVHSSTGSADRSQCRISKVE